MSPHISAVNFEHGRFRLSLVTFFYTTIFKPTRNYTSDITNKPKLVYMFISSLASAVFRLDMEIQSFLNNILLGNIGLL